MDNLKPCPFCGGDAKERFDEDSRPGDVRCSLCGANGPWKLWDDCWNTRPIEDRLRRERDELKSDIISLHHERDLAHAACEKYKRAADEAVERTIAAEAKLARIKQKFGIDENTSAPLAVVEAAIYDGERANFILVNDVPIEIGGASGHVTVIVLPREAE